MPSPSAFRPSWTATERTKIRRRVDGSAWICTSRAAVATRVSNNHARRCAVLIFAPASAARSKPSTSRNPRLGRPRSATHCASRWSRHLEKTLIRNVDWAIVQSDFKHVREERQLGEAEVSSALALGQTSAKRFQDLQAL